MGAQITTNVLFAVGLLIFVSLARELDRKWRFRSWAKQMGCAEPPSLPNILPGGLEHYVLRFSSAVDKLDFGEVVARQPFVNMNAFSYKVNKIGSHSTLYTIEPENAKACLSTKFDDWELGPLRGNSIEDCFGHGIITAEGPEWAHFRKQLKPHFSRENISNLRDAEHHLQLLFKALPPTDASGWTTSAADMVPMFLRLTMDTSTNLLFGESVNSQTRAMTGQEGHDDTDFAAAVDYAVHFICLRARLDFMYWIVPTGKFRRATKTIHQFIDNYVNSALHGKGSGMRDSKTVLLEELTESTRDPQELRDQVLQLLIAGRNTTGNLLSFAILFLSRDKNEYNKAREEVLAAFPRGETPTFETVKACKWLNYICLESLRLLPVTLLSLPRRAKRDTTLPRGGGPDGKMPVAIRKGALVTFSQYGMYRRHDIWGPDADEFRPGRWEGRKLGSNFMPFSTGPRTCLGQQMALIEAGYVIARLLQEYDAMEHVGADLPLETRISQLTTVADGVKVHMHKAPQQE